jgi:hypothetical protein
MAGFLIATVACMLPFLLGTFGLGRPRVVVATGAVLATNTARDTWVAFLAW